MKLTRTRLGIFLAIIGLSILLATASLLVARESWSGQAATEPLGRR